MRALYLRAAGAAAMCLASGLLAAGQAQAQASADAGVRPVRVYAPYFETYLPGSLASMTRRAGTRFATLAFADAAGRSGPGACTLDWDGTGIPLSQGTYRQGIDALRGRGGGAIISFGGWTADEGGTEIAESCHSVPAIAAAYEQAITTYGTGRLSMDLEGNAVTGHASIARRDRAIALLERWAKAHHIPLWIQLTLPVKPSGLNRSGLAVLRDAIKNRARISSISLMVFDYYFDHETRQQKMGALGITAAVRVHLQLRALYPKLTSTQIWHLLGLTMMPGIDNYPRRTEVTHLPDARAMMNFATAKRMNSLSIWGLHRDNGGCPGVANSSNCSGIQQRPQAFSHLLDQFTG
jgi:hypothetical protein